MRWDEAVLTRGGPFVVIDGRYSEEEQIWNLDLYSLSLKDKYGGRIVVR